MAADSGSERSSSISRPSRVNVDEEFSRKDKLYRRYNLSVERALSFFDNTLQEWADYISFLGRLLKALQSHPLDVTTIPQKRLVSKRLAQCLNPSLPSGVHQKALEIYAFIFDLIGEEKLSEDLPTYLPGLCPVLTFASLSIRPLFLSILEKYVVRARPNMLRPALKAIVLALLPGLEDETSEDFERVLVILDAFRGTASTNEDHTISSEARADGDYFWQCFFLASIASFSRRQGVLSFLLRRLPRLGGRINASSSSQSAEPEEYAPDDEKLPSPAQAVLYPEPGLLVRCFVSGLSDEHLLVQRGFLDLLVTHIPLDSPIFRNQISAKDQELLVSAAIKVVTRKEMSLNRRLWAWLLGPDLPQSIQTDMSSASLGAISQATASQESSPKLQKGRYFQEFGLHLLTSSTRDMFERSHATPAERSRQFQICISLMDRWEIASLIVPEIFIPALNTVRHYKATATTEEHFLEVFRSANVFFDAVESGVVCAEILKLLVSTIKGSLSVEDRIDSLALGHFAATNFNLREEDMLTIHLPLIMLAVLDFLEAMAQNTRRGSETKSDDETSICSKVYDVLDIFANYIPARAFSGEPSTGNATPLESENIGGRATCGELGSLIFKFYTEYQGDLKTSHSPIPREDVGKLLLEKSASLAVKHLQKSRQGSDVEAGVGLFISLLNKLPVAISSAFTLISTLENFFKVPSRSDKFSPPFSTPLLITRLLVVLRQRETVQLKPFLTNQQMSQILPALIRHLWTFLSPTNIKSHVEAVSCIWKLQAAMVSTDHTIEACICSLIVEACENGATRLMTFETAQKVALLWTLSLSAHGRTMRHNIEAFPFMSDSYGQPKNLTTQTKYRIMLSRPMSLLLDTLSQEGTEQFFWIRSWLQSLTYVDKLVRLIAGDIVSFSFMAEHYGNSTSGSQVAPAITLKQGDNLEHCIYFFETLLRIFRWCDTDVWETMATEVIGEEDQLTGDVLSKSGLQPTSTILVFMAELCIRAVGLSGNAGPSELATNLGKLRRTALAIIQQLLATPYSSSLVGLRVESSLIQLLMSSVSESDYSTEVTALDTLFAALSLQITQSSQSAPLNHQQTSLREPPKSPRQSFSLESSSIDASEVIHPLISQLGQCLLAGFASRSNQPILDSWVRFLAASLPMLSRSIFQILIPLVDCLCNEVSKAFQAFRTAFSSQPTEEAITSDAHVISLLTGLELTVAYAHECLGNDHPRITGPRSLEQPSFFGNMVSGVFSTEASQARSAIENNKLGVFLAFQDTVRICFDVWSWGFDRPGSSSQEKVCRASFAYTSTRIRNKARRLLERLFAAEPLECPEILIGVWCQSLDTGSVERKTSVIDLLHVLAGSRPKTTLSAVFAAINSRTTTNNPESARKVKLTGHLTATDLVTFLSEFGRSIDDDAMEEIWSDCIGFLRDVLANPFPHRQIIPTLLEFTTVLGEKMDNTSFGDQRMWKDLCVSSTWASPADVLTHYDYKDIFLRLLTATFTIKPMGFSQDTPLAASIDRSSLGGREVSRTNTLKVSRGNDIVAILTPIVPRFNKVFIEVERSVGAAQIISTNVIGPAFRSKAFPENLPTQVLDLLYELTKLPNTHKIWKKDITEALNHLRFFSSGLDVVKEHWLRLIRQWVVHDKDRMPELLGRLTQPTTAGIMFGVGASSARLEADRKTQLNLRRVALLIIACSHDTFIPQVTSIEEKIEELLTATRASSPSSATRAEIYMVLRALVLRLSSSHLFSLWSIVSAELHAALASVPPEKQTQTYNDVSLLQACKLLDTLIVVAPEEFQLQEWLFITDSIDAVYRSPRWKSVALVDEIAESLGRTTSSRRSGPFESIDYSNNLTRKPLLGLNARLPSTREELMSKVLQPFFSRLSIFAFESTYSMGAPDLEACTETLLGDLFDESTIVKD